MESDVHDWDRCRGDGVSQERCSDLQIMAELGV